MTTAVYILYTNYKGKTAWRHIEPRTLYFGRTHFHPEDQWLLQALDLDKGVMRDFAVKDITAWQVCPPYAVVPIP